MKLQRRFGIEFYEMDAAAFNRMGRQARQERDREQGHDDGRGTAV